MVCYPLFAMRPGLKDEPFRIITAKQLYSERIQWFEPLADGFRPLSWVHPDSEVVGSESYRAYKHFVWSQIIDFAVVDRWSIDFRAGGQGDWKGSPKGGDGYLLVSIEGYPYWADAIGQIPFAVDTFKAYVEETGSAEKAIVRTIETGMKYGDGSVLFGVEDGSNAYDNFMVLRGALWAAESHSVSKKVEKTFFGNRTVFRLRYRSMGAGRLKESITKDFLGKYGMWVKPK